MVRSDYVDRRRETKGVSQSSPVPEVSIEIPGLRGLGSSQDGIVTARTASGHTLTMKTSAGGTVTPRDANIVLNLSNDSFFTPSHTVTISSSAPLHNKNKNNKLPGVMYFKAGKDKFTLRFVFKEGTQVLFYKKRLEIAFPNSDLSKVPQINVFRPGPDADYMALREHDANIIRGSRVCETCGAKARGSKKSDPKCRCYLHPRMFTPMKATKNMQVNEAVEKERSTLGSALRKGVGRIVDKASSIASAEADRMVERESAKQRRSTGSS